MTGRGRDDYWEVGVSESHLEGVRKYIHGQEEHHRTKIFNEEVEGFMAKYGRQMIKEEGRNQIG